MLVNILSQLGIDETLWIQLGVFLLIFMVLRTLYFRPFLSIMERREREGEGKRKEAEVLLKKAKEEESRYERELFFARQEAKREQEENLSKVKEETARELMEVRQANKKKMEVAREEIGKEASAIDFEKQSENLSKGLVEKLTQSKVEL